MHLIAVDMDGTCLDTRDRLHDETLHALRAALAAGVAVVPATGRNLLGVPRALRELDGVRYVITSNGAAIYDLAEGRRVWARCIPCAQAASLLERCSTHGAPQAVTIDENVVDGDALIAAIRRTHFHDFPDSQLHRELPAYVRALGRDPEKLHIFYLKRWRSGGVLELLCAEPGIAFSGTPGEHTEIVAAGVNKGAALARLCGLLGVAAGDAAAIGDSDNDVSMLRFAGRSFAMGSAPDDVKAAATDETADSDHDGAALAVYALLRDWREST